MMFKKIYVRGKYRSLNTLLLQLLLNGYQLVANDASLASTKPIEMPDTAQQ